MQYKYIYLMIFEYLDPSYLVFLRVVNKKFNSMIDEYLGLHNMKIKSWNFIEYCSLDLVKYIKIYYSEYYYKYIINYILEFWTNDKEVLECLELFKNHINNIHIVNNSLSINILEWLKHNKDIKNHEYFYQDLLCHSIVENNIERINYLYDNNVKKIITCPKLFKYKILNSNFELATSKNINTIYGIKEYMSFLFYFKNHTELKWMIYNFGIYNKLFNNILDMKDFKFLDQIIDEYKNINIYNVFIMNFNDEDILELIKYKNIMKYLNESKIHILVKSINMIDILYKINYIFDKDDIIHLIDSKISNKFELIKYILFYINPILFENLHKYLYEDAFININDSNTLNGIKMLMEYKNISYSLNNTKKDILIFLIDNGYNIEKIIHSIYDINSLEWCKNKGFINKDSLKNFIWRHENNGTMTIYNNWYISIDKYKFNIDIIGWYFRNYEYSIQYHRVYFEYILKMGSYKIIEYYFNLNPSLYSYHMTQACSKKYFNLIRLLIIKKCPITKEAFELLLLSNNLEMLKTFLDSGCPIYKSYLKIAIKKCNLETLKWVYNIYDDIYPYTEKLYYTTIEKLEYLISIGFKLNERVLHGAIYHNDQKIINWLIMNGCPMGASLCRLAIQKLDLNLLIQLRNKGCKWSIDSYEYASYLDPQSEIYIYVKKYFIL